MSEILLRSRRPVPHQRAVPSPVAPPHPVAQTAAPVRPARPARPAALASDAAPAEPAFAARNSPTDLLFRALWQLVGVYVFLVLLVKDHKLPR